MHLKKNNNKKKHFSFFLCLNRQVRLFTLQVPHAAVERRERPHRPIYRRAARPVRLTEYRVFEKQMNMASCSSVDVPFVVVFCQQELLPRGFFFVVAELVIQCRAAKMKTSLRSPPSPAALSHGFINQGDAGDNGKPRELLDNISKGSVR